VGSERHAAASIVLGKEDGRIRREVTVVAGWSGTRVRDSERNVTTVYGPPCESADKYWGNACPAKLATSEATT
jgi:hypothetical protein